MFFFFTPPPVSKFSEDLDRLAAALLPIAEEFPQLTVGAFTTLLYVGTHQEEIWRDRTSLAELAKEIDIRPTTLARHADVLGEGAGKIRGMNFLERAVDPDARKHRILHLTEKGEALLRKVEQALAK